MKPVTRTTYHMFWHHAKTYPVALFVVFFGVVAGSLVNLIPALYYKQFFDVLQFATGTPAEVGVQLTAILFNILGMFFLSWLIWRVLLFTHNYFLPRVMRDLDNTCFAYLHKHAPTFFHNNFVGSLVKRVNKFSRAFDKILNIILFDFTRIVVDLTFILIVLSIKNWVFGVVIGAWVVLFVLLNYFWSMYKLKFDVMRSEQDSKQTGVLADTITNHDNVKLLVGYERERSYFAEVSERLRYLNTYTWNLGQAFETIQVLLMFLLEFGIMYLSVGMWKEGALTIGDFFLINTYVIGLFHKLWDIGRYIRDYYEHLADAAEMTEIFETPIDIVNTRNAKPLVVERGEIDFDRVTFQYNKTRSIIKDFTLSIASGQRIALVGHSGAGKSTIVKLLLRSHDVTSGTLMIDGQRIDKVTLESLWQNVSYVPQDPILFHRTLMDNIRYGKPEATDEEVMEAARLAHAHEFIQSFPERYETFVGERGVKLSGGERQRVAIARAILKNSPILILDEATSSLDSESERLIQDALQNLMKGKTVIVIAHRLSTIMAMDRILVIEDGEVVEDGTHKQLLRKKNGFYKKLWDIQAGTFIGE
jgi:ATP-binding cassette subfamily B protein